MKGEKKWLGALLLLCCVVFGSTPVCAYMSEGPCVDINNSNLKASGFINSSDIDYKIDIGSFKDLKVELERKIIGFSLTKGISKQLDVFGTAGYLFDGSLKPENVDDFDMDSGYFLSAGARYMLYQSGNLSFHMFGQFDYILKEKYSTTQNGVDADFELDGYELTVGGAIRFQVDDSVDAYASLSFVPLTGLSYDYEERWGGRSSSSDGDLERDDNLGFRVGASYLINDQWSIRGEANFVSDKAFLVSAGMRF